MTENIEFYQNQIALARTEIKNLRYNYGKKKQQTTKHK